MVLVFVVVRQVGFVSSLSSVSFPIVSSSVTTGLLDGVIIGFMVVVVGWVDVMILSV